MTDYKKLCEELQAENERLKKQLYETVTDRNALKKRLDAAAADLKECGACDYCDNADWQDETVCRNYSDGHTCFKWRGEEGKA